MAGEGTRTHEDEVKGYYEDQVERFGLSPESTLADQVIRAKEIEALLATVAAIAAALGRQPRILEVGCGNGTLLERLRDAGYTDVVGTDYLEEFIALASSRKLPFEIRQADDDPLSPMDREVRSARQVQIRAGRNYDQNRSPRRGRQSRP